MLLGVIKFSFDPSPPEPNIQRRDKRNLPFFSSPPSSWSIIITTQGWNLKSSERDWQNVAIFNFRPNNVIIIFYFPAVFYEQISFTVVRICFIVCNKTRENKWPNILGNRLGFVKKIPGLLKISTHLGEITDDVFFFFFSFFPLFLQKII